MLQLSKRALISFAAALPLLAPGLSCGDIPGRAWRGGPAESGEARLVMEAAWRDARLREMDALHEARIAAYAREYGIGRELSRKVYEAARAEQVSPALAFGLVHVESGFDPRARGPHGSIGLTQLLPRTARQLAPGVQAGDLYSPRLNLRLGFRYLRDLLDRFDENVLVALSAYNRGPELVQALLERGRDPRNGYARKVLRTVEESTAPAL